MEKIFIMSMLSYNDILYFIFRFLRKIRSTFVLPCIVFSHVPTKFCTSIWKLKFSNSSLCLTTNTGWGREREDPLYSSALTLISWTVSPFFSFLLHWTSKGSGIDWIATVNHWLPSFFLSNLANETLGIPVKIHCLLHLNLIMLFLGPCG